jgi:cytochrome P450
MCVTSTVDPSVDRPLDAATELPAGFDPTDPDVMRAAVPHQELLTLRRTAPVSFIEQPEPSRAGFPDHAGYWALSRHADVAAVSKDQANFSTYLNGVIIRFAPDHGPRGRRADPLPAHQP